jgi:RsmE family RNA methyltransferase
LNLVLLDDADLRPDGTARLAGRRALHVHQVLRAPPGARILAGRIGGKLGHAVVLAAAPDEVLLAPALDRDPPPPAPVSLLLALPRPKILRKILQGAASMGVKRIVLVGSHRVEKSYWSSPVLAPGAIRTELLLGLEQGRDTVLPAVEARRLFKPFVEDELDALLPAELRVVADPAGGPLAPAGAAGERAVLAVGPEGGWTAYERQSLERRGFVPFGLGPRALRVDVAVPYAIGQVDLWLRSGRGRLTPALSLPLNAGGEGRRIPQR